ncbi:hypothetical protein JOM56_007464 [Amanita muscaria]
MSNRFMPLVAIRYAHISRAAADAPEAMNLLIVKRTTFVEFADRLGHDMRHAKAGQSFAVGTIPFICTSSARTMAGGKQLNENMLLLKTHSVLKPNWFIKGYKIKPFGNGEDDPDNTRFFRIVKLFPRETYQYIETWEDADGKFSLVLVLDDGPDKETLEKTPIPPFDQRGAEKVLDVDVAEFCMNS